MPSLKPFLSSVKVMLTMAETEREFLLSVGLSELALTGLKKEVEVFEDAIEAGCWRRGRAPARSRGRPGRRWSRMGPRGRGAVGTPDGGEVATAA